MEVNNNNSSTELEEGEASCYYKDDDENFDPDTDLAYLEDKLDQVLGHFQKDFEGGAFAENLGAKYGGYGSFLPTYERSPSVLSTPKTLLGNCNTSRSPKSSIEGASQNLKASSIALPTVRPGTSSPSARLSHNFRVLGCVSSQEDLCVPSTQVAEKCTLKDEMSNRSGNSSDQRTLKFRIKMNSENSSRKNIAIYSGLGLSSPSSSFGNNPDGSGEMPPASQVNVNESLTNIIKVMTSFPVPGHCLMSPLHDSFICLTRKKKLHQHKIVPQSKGPQECSLSASTKGNGNLSKELNVEVAGKGEEHVEPKIDNFMNVKNGMKILIKKKSGTHCLGSKELLSNGYKSLQLSNSVGDVSDCAQVIHRTPNSGITNENGVKGSLSISGLAKQESKESISAHSFDKNEKQNSRCGSAEKIQKLSEEIFHKNGPAKQRDGGKLKGHKFSASLDYSAALKCKEELDQHPQNAGEETTYHDQGKTNVHGKKEKLYFKGKIKSKEKLVAEKQPGSLTNGSFGVEIGIATEDELNGGYNVCLSSRKAHKLKLQKDTVRENRRDSLGNTILELRDKMEVAERHVDDFDVQCKSSKVKPSEKPSGRKVDNRLMSRGSVKDAFATCLPTFENGLASHIIPVAAAPIVLLEDWVGCDNCQKWRLLPFGRKDQLPEKWLCSMLDWLGPGMNRCDISEEETTKALNALYQQPPSESSTNPPTHAIGTASVVPSDHAQHLYQNSMYDRVKRRLGVKERLNTVSGGGVLESYLQEPVKCTGLKDVNQSPLQSNSMKKSTDQRMTNLQNLGMEENIAKHKEKQRSGGDAKRVRLNHKKDTDHHICGTSKKPRREDMLHADKDRSSDIDLGRMGVTSGNGLLTCVLDQNRNSNDFSSEGTKPVELQFSFRKPGHQSQVSLDGGPCDVRMCSKRDNSMKKKRNREWQNNVETFVHSVNDGRVYNEKESSESGSWREKKARNSKTECKDSTTSNIDDKSDRKSKVTKIVVSGTKALPTVAMSEDKNIVKDQQPRNHSKRNASQRNLEGATALKRDTGSGHVSLAAASSSSKISGSHKFRGDIEEVKGSSVESVSSSPLRTSNSNRPTLAKGDGFVKNEPICGGFSLTIKSKRRWDGDGNGSFDRLGNTRTEKTSNSICPESHKFLTGGYHRGDASGNGQFLNDQRHDDDRENKNHPEDVSFQKRSSNGSSLPSKDNIRGSSSDLDRDKMKISDPVTEYSQKSQRYVSEINLNHDVRNNLPEMCSIETVTVKDEKNYVIKRDNVGQGSSGSAVETQLQQKGYEVSDEKLGATEFPIKKGAPRQNMNQDFGCGQKQNKSSSGKPTSSSNSHSESKEGAEGVERKEGARCRGSQAMAWPEREAVLQGLPSFAVNGNVQKSSRQCGTATTKNGDTCNVGHLMPDHQGARDVMDSIPIITASGQIAIKILNEARSLRDKAEQSKKGGFHDVSTVAYFQAAQKFLQGASLLESCSYEKGKHGDMTPLQVYSSTAKLCEFCAHEYENLKEAASAALAYKCMEVAYMRVVYCKHSSITRDRHELEATLNMPHQGESPSSSASDIDNLTNQVMAEKAVLSKGTGSHVARNCPKILRLLDFTQDVNFAMEASEKSQSAFSAACLALEDSHKNDCISSIRRVIEFSFQDVDEFVRLVELAMKAIGQSKFTGPRD